MWKTKSLLLLSLMNKTFTRPCFKKSVSLFRFVVRIWRIAFRLRFTTPQEQATRRNKTIRQNLSKSFAKILSIAVRSRVEKRLTCKKCAQVQQLLQDLTLLRLAIYIPLIHQESQDKSLKVVARDASSTPIVW